MKKKTLGRSLKMLKMAAKVGLLEWRSGNLQSRLDQATTITETLSHLKGAAMKAGQMLSLELSDYFPPEAVEILSRMQSRAPPCDTGQLHHVLLEELGAEKVAQLKELTSTPVAAASIGQVHRAKVKDVDVAVKIQYPGVREAIGSDLKALYKVAKMFCVFTGRSMDLNPLFAEFHAILSQEVNYLNEAKHMQTYKKLIDPHNYNVPDVLPEFSHERVVTMTWEDGVPLRDWIGQNHPTAVREQLAILFLDLFCLELFSWGLVQTDPNYANFLVSEKPHLRLTLLDFGATKQYSPEFRRSYIQLLQKIENGHAPDIIAEGIHFGLLNERESKESQQLFFELVTHAVGPFFVKRQGSPRFQFSDPEYLARSRALTQRFAHSLKYSPPPHQILFLHRKLGGIFMVLKKLNIELDITPYWQRMLHSKV